jgi:hypothetical protein
MRTARKAASVVAMETFQICGAPPRPDQHPVLAEHGVDVGAQAHPGGRHQDEVVGDPLEIVHQVRGEHHRDVTFDGQVGEGGEKLAPGERIERGERLVEQQHPGPLGQRQAQRDLGSLPTRQCVHGTVERDPERRQALP